jgi:transposase
LFCLRQRELWAIIMLNDTNDAAGEAGRVAAPSRSVHRRRWSAAEKAAVVKETLVPGARVSDVARRWQVDAQQVYRWRHCDGVTNGRPIRPNDVAEPAFVPIVTAAMPVVETPAVLASPVIEVRLAGAVVRVVSGLDDAQLTAVRASALRA